MDAYREISFVLLAGAVFVALGWILGVSAFTSSNALLFIGALLIGFICQKEFSLSWKESGAALLAAGLLGVPLVGFQVAIRFLLPLVLFLLLPFVLLPLRQRLFVLRSAT